MSLTLDAIPRPPHGDVESHKAVPTDESFQLTEQLLAAALRVINDAPLAQSLDNESLPGAATNIHTVLDTSHDLQASL